MQSGQWSLLLDLIGAGAVVVALAYGIFVRWHIRKMEQPCGKIIAAKFRVSSRSFGKQRYLPSS